MNKILIYGILCLFVLSGCKKKDDSIETVNKKNRTVLMYLFQDSNLWEALTQNINDVEQGWNDDIDGTMLIYVDPSTNITQFGGKPVLLEIRHDETDLIVSKVVKVYQDRDATDVDVFKQAQQDAIDMYPAQSYGLIVSGHGNGFFVNPDTKDLSGSTRWSTNGLDIDVMAKNLATHYDFIILDACLMGETTTLYQLRDATDFVMASAELSPGDGFAYSSALNALFTQPQADLHTFTSHTGAYYRENPNGQDYTSYFKTYTTFGVYRMSEAENLAAVTKKAIGALNLQYNELLEAFTDIVTNPEREIPTSMYYPSAELYEKLYYYDMGLLIMLLKDNNQKALADELDHAISKFVIQNQFALSSDFNDINPGYIKYTKNLSFYLPHSEGSTDYNDDAFYNRFDWAAAAGFSAKWETIADTHPEIKERL